MHQGRNYNEEVERKTFYLSLVYTLLNYSKALGIYPKQVDTSASANSVDPERGSLIRVFTIYQQSLIDKTDSFRSKDESVLYGNSGIV